jgi:hypothetical protein
VVDLHPFEVSSLVGSQAASLSSSLESGTPLRRANSSGECDLVSRDRLHFETFEFEDFGLAESKLLD